MTILSRCFINSAMGSGHNVSDDESLLMSSRRLHQNGALESAEFAVVVEIKHTIKGSEFHRRLPPYFDNRIPGSFMEQVAFRMTSR